MERFTTGQIRAQRVPQDLEQDDERVESRLRAGSGGRVPRTRLGIPQLSLATNDIHPQMAGDNLEGRLSTATATVKHSQSQNVEPYAVPSRPENANLLPGGTTNTAGGKVKDVTIIDGLKSIRLSDLKEVHTKPCVREALMTGIGAGFGIGGVRAILGGMLQIFLLMD